MTQFRNCAGWMGLGLALLLSPAILVFAAPFTYGVCCDLAATAWVAPAALMTAAVVAMNAARRTTTRTQAVRAQAAKSIT